PSGRRLSLPAGELRLAFLEEGRHALGAVLAREATAEAPRLAAQSLLEREVSRRAREFAQHRHGDGRSRGDRAGDLERGVGALLLRAAFGDEARWRGGACAEPVAGGVAQEGAAGGDEPGQPLCPTAAGDEAELDLGLAEERVLGGDADVAAHRELEATAEAE